MATDCAVQNECGLVIEQPESPSARSDTSATSLKQRLLKRYHDQNEGTVDVTDDDSSPATKLARHDDDEDIDVVANCLTPDSSESVAPSTPTSEQSGPVKRDSNGSNQTPSITDPFVCALCGECFSGMFPVYLFFRFFKTDQPNFQQAM